VIEVYGDKIPGSGCLLLGDKGTIFSPDDYGAQFSLKLKGEKELRASGNHPACKAIPITLPRAPESSEGGHKKEWLNAIRGGPEAYSRFEIAGYLTEIILLGCIALRVGKKLEWDGPNMRATNAPEAARFVKRQYRKGWEL